MARLLRIGARPSDDVDGILILGGVHAREWVPPDALVSLAADLLEAHSLGAGLGYGSTSYTAAQVTHIIDGLTDFGVSGSGFVSGPVTRSVRAGTPEACGIRTGAG